MQTYLALLVTSEAQYAANQLRAVAHAHVPSGSPIPDRIQRALDALERIERIVGLRGPIVGERPPGATVPDVVATGLPGGPT